MRTFVRGCIASLTILCVWIAAGRLPAQGNPQGEQIFTEKAAPPCALCHTLKAANSSGTIGPDLDELKPSVEQVRRAVKNGVGIMPAYGETLSDAEITAVAEYVANAVGGQK